MKIALRFLFFILFLGSTLPGRAAAVWQWSVPVPSLEGRRAYLWIPPDCRQVRGLIVACQNMLEQPLFERPAFREAAAASDLGLLLIFSGHDKGMEDDKEPNHPKRSALDIFLNPGYPKGEEDPKGAGEDLQKALDELAAESGYAEIRYAPLMPVGHSSAGSFVWHLYRWDASRIFAMMPFKTGIKSDGPQDIPIFNVESEWFDYGSGTHNVSSKPSDISNQLRARGNGEHSQFGFFVTVGAGHCNVSDDNMGVLALWLKKAVGARIPENAPVDRPMQLKRVPMETGWMIDPKLLGRPGTKAIAYSEWPGDKKLGLWYLDRELAEKVQSYMSAQLTKKPQQLSFRKDDGSLPVTGGTIGLSPQFMADGATFKVSAEFIDHLDDSDLFPPGTKLAHSSTPIYYRVNSGGLVQVGPDTFRACPRSGPIFPQGQPWEPTLVAYNLGDKEFQPTERPAHININIVNKEGAPQTLDFPKVADQRASLAPASVKLSAKASSGLPVQYFMVSGPATIQGDTLVWDKMPRRARFPMRVTVSAFQWGRSKEPKVQSAGPVTQEFYLRK